MHAKKNKMATYPDTLDKITKARLRLSALGSVLSIALSMFFIGTLGFFAFFSTQYLNNLSRKIEMEVLFYSHVKEADIIAMEQTLKLKHYIEASRVSSRAENTENAKKIIGSNYTDIIPNPLNASIIINVAPAYANTDSLAKISHELKKNEIVQDVDYPDFIVKSVSNNFHKIQWIILGVCAVFIIISMLLIANNIRLNIYAKRFNIKSMLLVGATPRFVRKPFIAKGFVQGIWGGIIALLLIGTILFFGNRAMPEFIDFSQMAIISCMLGGVLVFSILFTTITSSVSVRRYIRINDERLYL